MDYQRFRATTGRTTKTTVPPSPALAGEVSQSQRVTEGTRPLQHPMPPPLSNPIISTACQNAAAAFATFSTLAPTARANILDAIAAALDTQRDTILHTCSEETALTIDELTPEFARMTGTLRMFATLIRDGSWVRAAIDTAVPLSGPNPAPNRNPNLSSSPIGPNHDLRSLLIPLGPVAVFGSSNFPLAYGVCGGDTASALAAGCPVIVKEHPAHPITGRLLAHIAQQAIMHAPNEPDAQARILITTNEPRASASGTTNITALAHLLQYIHNEAPTDFSIAQQLVQHDDIKAVGFTGSIPGGLAIEKLARERDVPIPVFAEMGSMNIAVILPGAMQRDPYGLAMSLADSVLMRCGQQCTKPGAILHSNGPGANAFVSHLKDRFQTSPSRRMLAEWIARSYHKKVMDAMTRGVYTLAMYDRAQPLPSAGSPILTETSAASWFDRPELREEIFGPTTMLVVLKNFSDLSRLPEQGSLAFSIWFDPENSHDVQLATTLLHQCPTAGRITFNGPPTGVRVATSTVHGGPFPATNRPDTTAVGPRAIERWCRPLCFQNCPDALLPSELQNANPRAIWRTINGALTINQVP